ncbi:MAG: creatininase family protein [Planctomycetes bacterium]|nr:creatininase family protein [Planctomycetota bacterium]
MPSTYLHDTSFYPKDAVRFPARLETLRVGQIRNAVERKGSCLLPLATLEAISPDQPIGFDPYVDPALLGLAEKCQAVIAPPLWYCPTGYTHGGPEDGTFDMRLRAFAGYVHNVLSSLAEIGFHTVRMVAYVDPADPARSEPLLAACRFVQAHLFNDLWKDAEIGRNWWDRPDRAQIHWQRYGLEVLNRPVQPEYANLKEDLPLRLRQLTPRGLQSVVAKGYPLFVPSAVIENHGNQNPVGCDGFEARDPLMMAAGEAPAVVGPAIWFGPTGYGVSGPELATTDIDGMVYEAFMEGVIGGLAAMGFGEIVFVQVHQGSGGAQWNGTAMAAQAYRASFSAREGYGPGWATRPDSSRRGPAIISQIFPPHAQYDHAGKNETSWMLHLRPQFTDLSLLRPNDYRFCWNPGNESKLATADWGETMCKKTVAALAEIIRSKVRPVAGPAAGKQSPATNHQ